MTANESYSKTKEYVVHILGKPHAVRKKTFNRKEFLASPSMAGLNGKLLKNQPLRIPLAPDPLFGWEREFDQASRAFDSALLIIGLAPDGKVLVASDFQDQAKQAFPQEQRVSKAYDLYALQLFDAHYPDLIARAKAKLLEQFRRMFAFNAYQLTLSKDLTAMGYKASFFSRGIVDTSTRALRAYRAMASQGHIYSQYLAGYLLAMPMGDHSPACVDYLLVAHHHKHPTALDVLAQYLLFKGDLFGAAQCGLISLESGNLDAHSTVKEALQIASITVMDRPYRGNIFLSIQIIEHLVKNGFGGLMQSRFPEFLPQSPDQRLRAFWLNR